MIGMDCENTSPPDETFVLMKPAGLEEGLACAIRGEDILTIQTESVSASEGPHELGPAFTTHDAPSDSSTVLNVSEGIHEWGADVFIARVPLSEFSLSIHNLETDSPSHILVNPARLRVIQVRVD